MCKNIFEVVASLIWKGVELKSGTYKYTLVLLKQGLKVGILGGILSK